MLVKLISSDGHSSYPRVATPITRDTWTTLPYQRLSWGHIQSTLSRFLFCVPFIRWQSWDYWRGQKPTLTSAHGSHVERRQDAVEPTTLFKSRGRDSPSMSFVELLSIFLWVFHRFFFYFLSQGFEQRGDGVEDFSSTFTPSSNKFHRRHN